jgi:putative ABC transport system substrate-binding protein
MRRRDFISFVSSAAAWPLAARAQQSDPVMRRIGVLMAFAEGDPEGESRVVALQQGLQELGWTIGRNIAGSKPIRRCDRSRDHRGHLLRARR